MNAHFSMMRLSQALFLAYNVSGFTLAPLTYRFQPFRSQMTDNDAPPSSWFNCGLLISSWTDGVANNPRALQFLKKSLACSLLSDLQHDVENAVETSVIQSPCCGPDTDRLSKMESVDEILATIQNDTTANVNDLLQQLSDVPMNLRVLYIPTAMYALRADSNNTPGKQRQRARADGKKRRTQVVRTIQKLFPKHAVTVSTITLDLHDGSVKQLEGADGFPQNGKEALTDWSPNLIYVEGGNTFWLHHCMTKGDWRNDLVSAITDGNAVYCGKSAGAILVGRTIETATWKGWDDPSIVPGMESYDEWKGVEGLDLVGGASFFPHMSEEWKELTLKKQNEVGQVYCLRDEDVCFVEKQSASIVSAHTALLSSQ